MINKIMLKQFRIKIELVSHNYYCINEVINKFIDFLQPKKTDIKCYSLPVKTKHFSVLKSPFANNKSIEQYALKDYKQCIMLRINYFRRASDFFSIYSFKNVAIVITFIEA